MTGRDTAQQVGAGRKRVSGARADRPVAHSILSCNVSECPPGESLVSPLSPKRPRRRFLRPSSTSSRRMESESSSQPSQEDEEIEFLFYELGGVNDEDLILNRDCDSIADDSPDSEWENDDLIDPERIWSPEGTLLDMPFTGLAPNITFILPKNLKAPMDYFKLFYNEDFMTLIVESININGYQIFLHNTFVKKYLKKWEPTNREEVATFLRMLFHLCLVRGPNINDFWKEDPFKWLKPPFESLIGEERFMILLRALMFKNSMTDTANKSAPYNKAKPFLDFFNDLMLKLSTPGEDLVLHKFYAQWPNGYDVTRFSRRKHFGFKLFSLNDPIGFTYKMALWRDDQDSELEWDKRVEQALDVLVNDYLDCGRTIYMSDIFCKPEFVEKMLQRKTYVTSSINQMFLPAPQHVQKQLKKSKDGPCLYNNNMCIFQSDKHMKRYIFSSKHTNEKAKKNYNESKTELEVNRALNRNFMHICSRIERLSDFTNSSYHLYTNSILHIMNVMFLNAYILYKFDNQAVTMSYSNFRKIISSTYSGVTTHSSLENELCGTSDTELSGSGSSYPPSLDLTETSDDASE